MNKILKTTALAVLALSAFGGVALAEGDGWTDVAEISLVATTGNSEVTSFGFKNTAARAWDNAQLTIRAGAINVETTSQENFAVGTSATDFSRVETTDTTAENYFVNGRYDRNITERFFWYTGLGWDRNEPSGIKNRMIGSVGVGNIWFDTDDAKFRTGYGLTYTDQEDVFVNPLVDDTFAGIRADWDYFNKLTETTSYTNLLVIDMNLDETSDWRADMLHGLTVSMSEKLALKLGLQWLYDAEPSFGAGIDVFTDPTDPTTLVGTTAPLEFDDLDQIFTASLVINF